MVQWRDIIRSALLANAQVFALTEGRIYTRRLRKDGPRAMPEAFDENGRYKTSIVVLAGTGTEDFQNPDALLQFPTVWIHSTDSDAGWADIDALVEHIRDIAPTIQAPAGTAFGAAEWQTVDELGTIEDDTVPGSIVNYVRLSDSTLYRQPA